MTQDQSALLDLLAELNTADEGSVMRRILASGLQALIEAEATATIGAGRHERTSTRTTQRNGSRGKTVTTTAGDITVTIPKTRTGSFFPSLLEPRRRIDRALHAVICEAYVHGVSTRKVDDLVAAMGGLSGVSKSEVSRICAGLDEEVGAFATRRWTRGAFPICSSTPPTARSASTVGSCLRRSWSLPGSVPTGGGRCSATPSATARPSCSGPSSCAACVTAG